MGSRVLGQGAETLFSRQWEPRKVSESRTRIIRAAFKSRSQSANYITGYRTVCLFPICDRLTQVFCFFVCFFECVNLEIGQGQVSCSESSVASPAESKLLCWRKALQFFFFSFSLTELGHSGKSPFWETLVHGFQAQCEGITKATLTSDAPAHLCPPGTIRPPT